MYLTRMFQEGSTQGGIGWLVWVALIIFFLMVVLGWLASSRGWLKKEAEPQPVGHGHADEHGHAAVAAPAVAASDDLTTLEGIGPKVARLLAGMGITTFSGLASADRGQLRSALDAAGYKYMDPAGWIDQAALAAKGDAAGLKTLQDSLKGGRKVA